MPKHQGCVQAINAATSASLPALVLLSVSLVSQQALTIVELLYWKCSQQAKIAHPFAWHCFLAVIYCHFVNAMLPFSVLRSPKWKPLRTLKRAFQYTLYPYLSLFPPFHPLDCLFKQIRCQQVKIEPVDIRQGLDWKSLYIFASGVYKDIEGFICHTGMFWKISLCFQGTQEGAWDFLLFYKALTIPPMKYIRLMENRHVHLEIR